MRDEMQAVVDELMAVNPTLEITYAGGICPFQAEGTLHGLPFYFRFRHNWAELRIQSADWWQPLYIAGGEYGEGEDQGWLTDEEFRVIMAELLGRLERAPILWDFPGVEPAGVGLVQAGTPTKYGAWGHTAEEAWERMHEPSPYLTEHGIALDAQAAMLAERQMSPQTITVDERVFPDPDPFARKAER
jgi:hypothetical protein